MENKDLNHINELAWSDIEKEFLDTEENQQLVSEKIEIGSKDDSKDDSKGNFLTSEELVEQEINIDYLKNIKLDVVVEIGNKKVKIEDLLKFDIDTILELNTKIGEPLNLLINGSLFAKGEVVVKNEKFAIKIIEILAKKNLNDILKKNSE